MTPPQTLSLQIVKGVAAGVGLIIALFSLLITLLIVIGLVVDPTVAAVDSTTVALGIIVLGAGVGGALAWQSGRAFFNYPSTALHLPPFWLFLILYIPVLIIGQVLISFNLLPILTFPPFHILAGILPPLIILAFVSKALRRADVCWREIILHLAGGAFLAMWVALILEIMLGLTLLVIVLTLTALTPTGWEFLNELALNLQNPQWAENPQNILEALRYPPLAVALGLIFIGLAPLIEELTKVLSVVAMSYRRPALARAFLWGIAAGAGLGVFENLFNTIAALELWVVVIFLRLGATLMHCLGAGLMALGWQQVLAERRIWPFLKAYGASVGIHATWNALVIGIAATSIFATESPTEAMQFLSGGVVLFLLGGLALLMVGMVALLVTITRRLERNLEVGTPERSGYIPTASDSGVKPHN